MAVYLVGDKAFENELVVVYEVRHDNENAPTSETIAISKSDPKEWCVFGAPKDLVGGIYIKALRFSQSNGHWSPRVLFVA